MASDSLNISNIIDEATMDEIMSNTRYVSSYVTLNETEARFDANPQQIDETPWFAANPLMTRYNATAADTQELQVLLTSWNLGHLLDFFLGTYLLIIYIRLGSQLDSVYFLHFLSFPFLLVLVGYIYISFHS